MCMEAESMEPARLIWEGENESWYGILPSTVATAALMEPINSQVRAPCTCTVLTEKINPVLRYFGDLETLAKERVLSYER